MEALKARMEQIRQSPEYQANCQRFSQECARLEAIARDLYAQKDKLQAHCEAATIRTEYASGSTLHRGFYCPSPTYDLIVGNTKRGKLLKKRTALCSPSHEYGFDANDKLLYCKWFAKKSAIMTEYLDRRENEVYGILLDTEGRISAITEEIYEDGKLVRYARGLCIPSDGSFFCREIHCEEYEYDAIGLCRCQMHHLIIPLPNPPGFLKEMRLPLASHPVYQGDCFQFERTDGYLTGYICGQHTYRVGVRRRA